MVATTAPRRIAPACTSLTPLILVDVPPTFCADCGAGPLNPRHVGDDLDAYITWDGLPNGKAGHVDLCASCAHDPAKRAQRYRRVRRALKGNLVS